MLRRAIALTAAAAFVMLVPAVARAQSAIAGVVKDVSGAVLPGVTVEASSDVLIEKTRAVVTDGSGQYKIVDLRPGVYVVTFTLSRIRARSGVKASSFPRTSPRRSTPT